MKKLFLLSIAVCLTGILSAQIQENITPIWQNTTDAHKLMFDTTKNQIRNQSDYIVFGSGNELYVVGSFTEPFTFAGTDLEAVALGSTYILKYDAKGDAVWAASIFGAAKPTAIAIDSEDNIYIAGNYADQIVFKGATGNEITKAGREASTAMSTGFIAKYSKEGAPLAVQTFIPGPRTDIPETLSYLPEDGQLLFETSSIALVDNKVYIAAILSGEVAIGTEILKGSYLNIFDFMASDETSAAIVCFNKDLSIDGVVSSVVGDDNSTYANAMASAFVTSEGNKLYTGFVLSGKMTYKVGTHSERIELPFVDKPETFEYFRSKGFLLNSIENNNLNWKKLYVAQMEEYYASTVASISGMAAHGNTLLATGVYSDTLAFDKTAISFGKRDAYMAILDKTNGDAFGAVHLGTDSIGSPQLTVMKDYTVLQMSYKRKLTVSSPTPETITTSNIGFATFIAENNSDKYALINSGGDNDVMAVGLGSREDLLALTLSTKDNPTQYMTQVMKFKGTSGIGHIATDDQLTFFPNPAQETIHFSKECNVSVYNTQGQHILSAQEVQDLDVNSLSKGLYIVKMTSKEGTKNMTLNKQ